MTFVNILQQAILICALMLVTVIHRNASAVMLLLVMGVSVTIIQTAIVEYVWMGHARILMGILVNIAGISVIVPWGLAIRTTYVSSCLQAEVVTLAIIVIPHCIVICQMFVHSDLFATSL
jgi:hypothetical protein